MTAAARVESEGTAVAVVEKSAIVKLLGGDVARRRIEPMLRGARYEEVMSEVWLAVQQNPAIMECTQASIVAAVAHAVASGGRIGRDVHLVPFNTKTKDAEGRDAWEKRLTAIEDYKFLAELVIRSGGARKIVTRCVYEKEEFRYVEGLAPDLRHVPVMDPAKRGKLVGAYAFAIVGRGEPVIVTMSAAEIDALRQRYSKSWKSGDLEKLDWYAKKTCVRQLAKLLPTNPRLAKLLAGLGLDEHSEDAGEGFPAAAPAPMHQAPVAVLARYDAQEPAPTVHRLGGPRETEEFQDDTDIAE